LEELMARRQSKLPKTPLPSRDNLITKIFDIFSAFIISNYSTPSPLSPIFNDDLLFCNLIDKVLPDFCIVLES
jgi:hypothetical protein